MNRIQYVRLDIYEMGFVILASEDAFNCHYVTQIIDRAPLPPVGNDGLPVALVQLA